MPKVSVNILTKNRLELFKKAILSVKTQSFKDFEILVVNDGSQDDTQKYLEITSSKSQVPNKFKIINNSISKGITLSRQVALEASSGEYIAVLDDDDEWVDTQKLQKQVDFLDAHQEHVLVGGGISIINSKNQASRTKLRSQTDENIRQTMLLRNNFFTSTVMFKREAAIKVGGFIKDQQDFAEDYDLWLRLGNIGKMFNFQEVFTKYTLPNYNKERFIGFLKKQKKSNS